jgi:hypothetical protein
VFIRGKILLVSSSSNNFPGLAALRRADYPSVFHLVNKPCRAVKAYLQAALDITGTRLALLHNDLQGFFVQGIISLREKGRAVIIFFIFKEYLVVNVLRKAESFNMGYYRFNFLFADKSALHSDGEGINHSCVQHVALA